jgi:predicted secreted protein
VSEAVTATGILVKRSGAAHPVVSSSVAAASVITTSQPHGMETGDSVNIAGHTGSTPALSGPYVVTRISATSYSIPVNVTVAGTGGTATPVENFVTVAEILSVTPPGFSRNKIETTTMNEGAESSVLGILRQKDPSFRVNYVGGNVTHARIVRDILENAKATWRVQFPSGVKFTGAGRVQKFEMADAPVDSAQQADITLAWAGAVTHAAV